MQAILSSKRKMDSTLMQVLGTSASSEIGDSSLLSDSSEKSGEKIFSFNQSFTNIEQNEKLIQEKTQSFSRIKSLEEEIKLYKSKANLWEKSKLQISNLNRYLNLNAINMKCSDSTIMKEFFQTIEKLVQNKDSKIKDQKCKLTENKKKEFDVYEKLQESNKRNYELQQQIIKFEHDLSKMQELNESIKEKSRTQSTERNSRVEEFHEDTLLLIQQKDEEILSIDEKYKKCSEQNVELTQQIAHLEGSMAKIYENLLTQEQELLQSKILNQALDLDLLEEKKKVANLLIEEKQTDLEIETIKHELANILEENLLIRTELEKRGTYIIALKQAIEEAKRMHEDYLKDVEVLNEKDQNKKKKQIQLILQEEEKMKSRSRLNSPIFRINNFRRSMKSIFTAKSPDFENQIDSKTILSEELLI